MKTVINYLIIIGIFSLIDCPFNQIVHLIPGGCPTGKGNHQGLPLAKWTIYLLVVPYWIRGRKKDLTTFRKLSNLVRIISGRGGINRPLGGAVNGGRDVLVL